MCSGTLPFQTRDRGREPRCRAPTRATRHRNLFGTVPLSPRSRMLRWRPKAAVTKFRPWCCMGGKSAGLYQFQNSDRAPEILRKPLLHNKRQQNKNNCRSVRASQQSVTLAKLMRTSALPSQPLDHPANMSLKQLINALTSRGFRQTHWRGGK